MRTTAGLALVLTSAISLAQDDARAVIEKAVNAQGGLELLTKQGASRGKVKGVYAGDNLEFTGEFHSHGPGRLRLALDLKEQGTRLLVLNGTKGWLVFDGITQVLDDATLTRMRKANYVDRVSGLSTLLKDPGYKLALEEDKNIDGKAAATVKVSSEGQPDVHLYFDKKSGLLVKSAHRGPDAGGNQDALQESYFRDYQPVGSAVRDEKILDEAKQARTGPELVKFLHKQIPDAKACENIKSLIRQLGDESFAVREKATAALLTQGTRAAALLRQARPNSDVEVARRVDKCLDRLGKDLGVAGAAVRLLSVRRPPGTVEALLAYYPWAPDQTVVREVEASLAALAHEDKEARSILEKALKDEDAQVRRLATQTLGKDGGDYLKRPGRRLSVEGLRLPRVTALFTDGAKRLELETLELEFFNRLDDALFERPDQGPER